MQQAKGGEEWVGKKRFFLVGGGAGGKICAQM